MMNKAAVITISDKGSRGERQDTSGPALCKILAEDHWEVAYTAIVPDDIQAIKAEMVKCADELSVSLVLTTGGTGFSPRDVTPEATLAVIEREVPGIPEAMRAKSMMITPMGCLSRSAAGIRGATLIINLPGSEKGACECLNAVKDAIRHGTEMLMGKTQDCGQPVIKILAVCISEQKGQQKHPVDHIEMKVDYGIIGDAHAGKWHRQVSLLGIESVAKIQPYVNMKLQPGAFAENILTEGVRLYTLPVGTRMKIGTAICEITQIGKECHGECAIRKAAGDCVMPREGIFVKVLQSGTAQEGDSIQII